MNIDRYNTTSFALPDSIRTTYEGVRTGDRGEFENVLQRKPKAPE